MDTTRDGPSRRTVLGLAAGLLGAGAAGARAQTAWKPSHPVNLIVPWAAGGSTDQVTRATASELEGPLGQTIVIINQPGASGAIGTRNTLSAARDGYTWTAGAAQDLGAYQTLGSLQVPIRDWNLYLSIANIAVLCVGAGSPYKTVEDIINAMKKRPERDLGRNRRRHLRRPYGDGPDRQGRARHLSPRHLRRRQPGRHRDRLRRGGRHHAVGCRRGRHDPRQASASAVARSATNHWSSKATARSRRSRTRWRVSPRR